VSFVIGDTVGGTVEMINSFFFCKYSEPAGSFKLRELHGAAAAPANRHGDFV
jgi:hypothetical protein